MSIDDFRDARDFLLALRTDYSTAKAKFAWPKFDCFNWALDWFDGELAAGEHGARPALTLLGERIETYSFAELSEASSRVANGLRALGAERGDRLLLMLGNVAPLWIALLAAMKLGLVVIPAPPQLADGDIAERLSRGRVRLVVAEAADAAKFEGRSDGLLARVAVGGAPAGWRDWAELYAGEPAFRRRTRRRGRATRCCSISLPAPRRSRSWCCTRHASYPVGHLTTMYGLGAAARRHASQHFLARLGQARVVECLRAVERRRDRRRADGRASIRAPSSTISPPFRSLRSAPRRRFGASSFSSISASGKSRCARFALRASRSIRT